MWGYRDSETHGDMKAPRHMGIYKEIGTIMNARNLRDVRETTTRINEKVTRRDDGDGQEEIFDKLPEST
eukprot:397245-Pelagomonas_calceolata.AAC.3